jgi:hypothetical protein
MLNWVISDTVCEGYSVSIEIRVRDGRPGFDSQQGEQRWIFSQPRPDRQWGTFSLPSNGYGRLFPQGIKRPEREDDHSPPSSAEVKNGWS